MSKQRKHRSSSEAVDANAQRAVGVEGCAEAADGGERSRLPAAAKSAMNDSRDGCQPPRRRSRVAREDRERDDARGAALTYSGQKLPAYGG